MAMEIIREYKNIIDNISKGKDNLGFGDIVEFFDNVDFDIPSF